MTTFFMQQSDLKTFHKMSIEDDVEQILKNATCIGKYRKLEVPMDDPEAIEAWEDRDDIEMTFIQGDHGIPDIVWLEKIPEEVV